MASSRVRFLVMLLATGVFTAIFANSLALNFTVICMWKEIKLPWGNGSVDEEEEVVATLKIPLFTNGQRSMLFSAMALGNLVGALIANALVQTLGVRKTVLLIGALSSFSTGLAPIFMSLLQGFGAMFTVRVVQGLAVAILFPLIGKVTFAWAPLSETGLFLAITSLLYQIAPVETMVMSGPLCASSFGWPAVYYMHAAVCALFVVGFCLVYRESPASHSWVSEEEKMKIADGRSENSTKLSGPTPVMRILTTRTTWVVLLSVTASSFAIMLVLQYSPTYLHKVVGVDVKTTGFLAAMPNTIAIIFKVGAGIASDHMPISQLASVRLFQSLAFLGIGVCFGVLALFGIISESSPPPPIPVAVTCFILTAAAAAITTAGVFKAAHLYSRQHSAFVFSLVSLSNSIVFFSLPAVVAILVPNDGVDEWRSVFGAFSIVMFAGLVLFLWGIDIQPASWTQPAKEDQDSEKEMEDAPGIVTTAGSTISVFNDFCSRREEDVAECGREKS